MVGPTITHIILSRFKAGYESQQLIDISFMGIVLTTYFINYYSLHCIYSLSFYSYHTPLNVLELAPHQKVPYYMKKHPLYFVSSAQLYPKNILSLFLFSDIKYLGADCFPLQMIFVYLMYEVTASGCPRVFLQLHNGY